MTRRIGTSEVYFGWLAAIATFACTTSNNSESTNSSNTGGVSSTASHSSVATGTVGNGGANAVGIAMGGSSSTSTSIDKVSPAPITCRKTGDGKTTLVLVNGCAAAVSVRGSNGVAGELAPGEHLCVELGSDTEPLNSLRYWGFIGEDPGAEHHTLAEMTLNTDFNDFDWYDISHVDAFNLPMQIVPDDFAKCRTLTCAANLLPNCPNEGLYRDSNGAVTACVSPDRNNASSPVARYFDAACSDAYSWSGDDAQSMVACAGEDYDVVFCP
jgi:hypothetical protein